MVNFPVAAGTSGHLIGGALAAILVGPYTGALCLAVVLLIQAVGFADGGLTAYGVNVLLMSLTATVVGYAVFRLVRAVLPRTARGVTQAAFAGGLASVPAAALAFVAVYAVGGTTALPLGTLAAAMGGIHVLIGLGEGFITAATVSAVLGVRPDLVSGARHLRPALESPVTPATRA
jgi:cobalt/nickel transport system permease protein